MDRLDEWRIFVAVATFRSFAEAARSSGRSPQTITRAVAALEDRLETRLLHRTTRSVSLTNDGERYLERARRALAELDVLEARDDPKATLKGKLSVTAPVLFGQLHVLPLVIEFLSAHRALDLRLVLIDRVVSLAEEAIDLAVRIGPLPDSSLIAKPLGSVRSVLCASPEYLKRAGVPKTLEALSDHAFIAFTATTPIVDRWSFPSSGSRERTISVHARLIVDSGQAAIDAALAGLGIVRVLSYQVSKLVSEKKLRILLPELEPKPSPVHLVHLPGLQTRAAHAFGERAGDRLKKLLADIDVGVGGKR
jgi:DNA-binding transcriptional LysR family regulator